MNKKKLTIISVALIMIMAVGGVLAYLTSTASVTNTFTVGDVKIELDEAVVDENGKAVEPEERTSEDQNYKLIPGQTYDKDPKVTVKKGSEESFVRMIMTVHNASAVDAIIANPVHGLTDYASLFDGWKEDKWLYEDFTVDTSANTISFEFRYFEPVAGADADKALEPLFTNLVIPGTLNNDELKALYADYNNNGNTDQGKEAVKIVVEGHAIQTAGFEDTVENGAVTATAEDNAWAAFDTQYEKNPNAADKE